MNSIVEINRILIENKKGEIIAMTPVQIYDKVMAYSQDPKAVWEFTAAELYRVTYLKDFPLCYVKDIYIAILNHFSNLELNDRFEATNEDQAAINGIYSRFILGETDDKNSSTVEARKGYLATMIEKATILAFSSPVYPIIDYERLKNKWRETKFNEYGEAVVNFQFLLELLIKDFQEFIKSSRENGILPTEEDLAKREEKNRDVLLKILVNM